MTSPDSTTPDSTAPEAAATGPAVPKPTALEPTAPEPPIATIPPAGTTAGAQPGARGEEPAAPRATAARTTTRPARAASAGAGATPTRGAKDAGADVTPGTLPRWSDRRQAAPLAKIGMAVFAVGLTAIAVSLVLFATGRTDLPLWINLVSMLAPVGLGIGLVGVIKEARAASPALAARKLEKEAAKAKASGDPSEEWNLPDLAASEQSESAAPRSTP